MERTRTHNLAVGSVCKLRAETLPTQPPRHPNYTLTLASGYNNFSGCPRVLWQSANLQESIKGNVNKTTLYDLTAHSEISINPADSAEQNKQTVKNCSHLYGPRYKMCLQNLFLVCWQTDRQTDTLKTVLAFPVAAVDNHKWKLRWSLPYFGEKPSCILAGQSEEVKLCMAKVKYEVGRSGKAQEMDWMKSLE